MPARLTPIFALLVCAALAAACSSTTTTPSSGGVPGIGPNFATNTIYVADTTGQAIEIYKPSPGPSSTPQYTIAGSNTTLSGPDYAAFDAAKNLFVTSYNTAQNTSTILEFAEYATGNVLPLDTFPLTTAVRARGIATLPQNAGFVVGATANGGFFTNSVLVYEGGILVDNIAGSNTQLNVPIGIAVDAAKNIYVGNNGGHSVTIYPLPTPSPTPVATSTPTASPSPTPTPVGATPSPTPVPTATPTPSSENVAPATTISGANTQISAPMGIALDTAGNLYIADAGLPTPRILVFDAPFGAGTLNLAPSRSITSASLIAPSDVKVDASGTIYVIDQGAGPSGTSKLLIFAANANGASVPLTTVPLPDTATGMALSP